MPQNNNKEEGMNVLFLNNEGEGFAKRLDLPEETTLESILKEQIDEFRPDNYVIRVNREPQPANYILKDGDRVSASPRKIEGA